MMRARRETTKPTLLRRALASLVSAAMVVAFTPVVAWGEETTVTLDINQGNIEITSSGYKIGNTQGAAPTGGYIIKSTANGAVQNTITVSSGTHDITLNGVIITVADEGETLPGSCAFRISDKSTVNLTLTLENTLQSAYGYAGLQVDNGSTLIVRGTGSLEAVGGTGAAGIGGSNGASGGNITIEGGLVKAVGNSGGAGIGDGAQIAAQLNSEDSISALSTFSTGNSGNAVIFASSISDQSNKDSWKGVIFEGANGVVYGDQTLSADLTVPQDTTLTVPEGTSLNISKDATLTNNGTITNSGKIYVDGKFEGTAEKKPANLYYPLSLTNAKVTAGTTDTLNLNDLYGKADEQITLELDLPNGVVFKEWSGLPTDYECGSDQSVKFTMPYEPTTISATYGGYNYTVQHYQQNTDLAGYTLVETEYCQGTVGAEAKAVTKSYTGFTYKFDHTDNVASGTIIGDGSLELKLYYNRNTYSITYTDIAYGATIVKPVYSYTYGIGAILPDSFEGLRSGCTFKGWTEKTSSTFKYVTAITAEDSGDKEFSANFDLKLVEDSGNDGDSSSGVGSGPSRPVQPTLPSVGGVANNVSVDGVITGSNDNKGPSLPSTTADVTVTSVSASGSSSNGTVSLSNVTVSIEGTAVPLVEGTLDITLNSTLQAKNGSFDLAVLGSQTASGEQIKLFDDNSAKLVGSLTIPDSVKRIEPGALSNCTNLKSLKIESASTLTIGERALSGCSKLEKLDVNLKVDPASSLATSGGLSLHKNSFSECKKLSTVTVTVENTASMLPSASKKVPVISIADETFAGCSTLKSLVIARPTHLYPDSLRPRAVAAASDDITFVGAIGENAFKGCTALSELVFDGSIESVGARAFEGCANLSSVPAINGEIGDYAFKGCSSLGAVPAGVISIGKRAFSGSGVKSVTISKGVKLGEGAFENCKKLSSAVIAKGVKSLPAYLFKGCSALKTVTVPSTVTKVERSVFSGCDSLKSVTLPKSVKSIGKNALWGASKVKKLTINSKQLTKKSVADCLKGSSVTTVYVPKSMMKTYAKVFVKSVCGKKVTLKLIA